MQESIIQNSRPTPYKTFLIKRLRMQVVNAFINCQFLCALETEMLASKSSINKIYKIHFRTLQIVYNVHDKFCQELLAVSSDISAHQKHLRILAIEVCKSLMRTNPDFYVGFLHIKPVPSDLLTVEKLYLPNVNATRCGLNSFIFQGSLFWNNLPTSIKISQSLTGFINNLRYFQKIHGKCVMCR